MLKNNAIKIMDFTLKCIHILKKKVMYTDYVSKIIYQKMENAKK